MRLTFRAKLLASHLALVAAVVLVTLFQLDRTLSDDLVRQLDQRLEEQALGAAEWVGGGRHPERLAARLARVVGAQVTLVEPDGRLIGDADLSEAGSLEMRPEIAAARSGAIGRATRAGADSGEPMRYVAVLAGEGAVLRLGVPLADITATVHAMRLRLLVAALVAVAAALVFALLASRLAARPLVAMTVAAGRIARGDYDIALPATSPDEFGALSRSLQSLAKQLRRLETVRRDFIANVSHELRTPVAAIQGYAETLLAPADRDAGGGAEGDAREPTTDAATRRRFLEVIHRHAQRLGRLVDDLLLLSELEARSEQSTTERIDVAPIAEHVALTLHERAAARGGKIEVDVSAEVVAIGDPVALEQVLENLVDNAIKYGRDAGTITISGQREGGRTLVSVTDDGPGIEPEHLPRIFERFYRVDPSRSRERGGTGLGLAIVKHLVESMGGAIAVESEFGRSCRFTVSLPGPRAFDG